MIYAVPAIALLAQQCAPEIATEAVVPLVLTESGGNALALNVNKGPRLRVRSAAEGAALARRYMAAGYTVDIGLAQVNSANLSRLGVTLEQAFQPCTNLKLASSVLRAGYGRAARYYTGLDAISATYSLYNTGTLSRGFRNGYVGRVWSAAGAIGSVQAPPALSDPPSSSSETRSAVARPAKNRDDWVVGQVVANVVEVFR